jgi:hypothetical protein
MHQSIIDNLGFVVGAAWYSAQQECNFSRADSEFIMLRSLWNSGSRIVCPNHHVCSRKQIPQDGLTNRMRCRFFRSTPSPRLSRLPKCVWHPRSVCVSSEQASLILTRCWQVLRISLAWGARFDADAQLNCPLHQPLPLPSCVTHLAPHQPASC